MKLSTGTIKKGDIISEVQYYRVTSVDSSGVATIMDNGEKISLGSGYLNAAVMYSADYVNSEEKVTKIKLEELFKEHPRVAMTVCFRKQPKEKDVANTIAELYPNKGKIISESEFAQRAKEIAKNVIQGELRVMRGRHYNTYGPGGRVQFIDMDIEQDTSKDYDTRMRLVDPRTIEYLIVEGVKYVLK